MKKTQFRSMIKQIIQEVVSEMDDSPGAGETPADIPSEPFTVSRDTDRRWRVLNARLQAIKKEPKFLDALDSLLKRLGDRRMPRHPDQEEPEGGEIPWKDPLPGDLASIEKRS